MLEQLLVRFSRLVVDNPEIRELDINPLLADSEAFIALDARAVLHERDIKQDQLPRPVIRPYPSHYSSTFALPTGQMVTIRAIRPEDESLMVGFHNGLSVLKRSFVAMQTHCRLVSALHMIDYRAYALSTMTETSFWSQKRKTWTHTGG